MAHPTMPEILAVASGSGSEEVRRHFASCPSCRELASLAEPPSPASLPEGCGRIAPRLEALIARRVARGADAELETHLRDCADCRVLVPSEDGDLPLQPMSSASYSDRLRLAEGGMGRLFRARDRRLGRDVVIKELRDERMARRFEQEARLTARLQHPAVVGVLEAGRWEDGSPFYVMELVTGDPLDQKIARCRKLEDRLALLPAVITVAEALAYAHDKQIVHRDVKPQNVMVGDFGESVLIDWGLAKDLNAPGDGDDRGAGSGDGRSSGALTMMGIGTPQYMPPEQAAGDDASPRMDVYALGATLYHLFAGRPPYEGSNLVEVQERLLREPPPSLDSVAPSDTPRELKSIIAKAMARDPADRFANAKLLANELVRLQTGRLVRSHRYSFLDRSRHWWRRYRTRIRGRVAIAAASGLALAAVVTLGRIVYERDRFEKANAALLVDLGRQELLAGSPQRALALLDEGFRRGARDESVRRLIASAGLQVEAFLWSADGEGYDFSPDGTRLLGTRGGELIEWDGRTGERIRSLGAGGEAAYSADGSRIVTRRGRTARLLDARTGAPVAEIDHRDGNIDEAVLTPDGTRLATISTGGAASLKIWDTRSRTMLASGDVGDLRRHDVGHARDRSHLAFHAFGGQRVEVWSLVSARRLHAVETTSPVLMADVSRDGALLVTAHPDGTGVLWDVPTGRRLHTLPAHGGLSTSARFFPDGRRIAVGGTLGRTTIWNAGSGALLLPIDTAPGLAGLSPDGSVVATSSNGKVQLWGTDDGALIASFEDPEGTRPQSEPGAVTFSRNGRLLFAGGGGFGQKDRITIWNAATSSALSNVPPDERSPQELRAFVRANVPWRVVQGRLVERKEKAKRAP